MNPTTASPSARRPIFVLCPERSGSTLLASCLGASPAVLAPPELHLLRYPTFEEWFQEYAPARDSLRWLLESFADGEAARALRTTFAGMQTSDLYRDLLQRMPPGVRLLDKTPAYSRADAALERLTEFDPDYVWLVRHPLAVARSRTRRRWARRRARNTTTRARLFWPLWNVRHLSRLVTGTWRRWEVRDWIQVNERIRAFLSPRPPERVVVVRFETLVRSAEKTLRALCGRMDLPYSETMLTPAGSLPESLRWGVGDEKIRDRPDIDARTADRKWSVRAERSLPAEAKELIALADRRRL